MPSPLAQTIKNLRKSRSLTLVAWAERCGVTQPVVSDWESARRRMSPEVFSRIRPELSKSEIAEFKKALTRGACAEYGL